MASETNTALVVQATMSTKEALIELVPAFERMSGYRVDITYTPAPTLIARLREGMQGDLFIGPEEYSDPLIAEGRLAAGTRVAFARSTTGLAVRAGTPWPDIRTPEKLADALLAAGTVSYSEGASGIVFAKALERLGIAAAIKAKFVAPRPGEMVGAVVARGGANIGIQQISALLPVPGIDIVGPLPAALQESILYGATAFAQSRAREAAAAFVRALRSEAAGAVLRRKGLEPA